MDRPLRRFCFKLALALGKDVREVLGWPSPLISEWLAYDQLDPLPDSWYQTGILASITANAWGKSKHRPEDFIPRVKTRRKQSIEEQMVILGAIAMRQQKK